MAGRKDSKLLTGPFLRVQMLTVLFLCGFAGLVAQMWNLQVLKRDYYTKKILNSSQVTVRIPSVRGEIKDRNGISLVRNRASYEVDFLLPAMVQSYKKLYGSVPLLKSRRVDSRGQEYNDERIDIDTIIKSAITPKLRELKLDEAYNSKKLRVHYTNKQLVPFTYRQDVPYATFVKYAERDLGLPGIKIGQKPVREYVYGALAAQILGYVGEPLDITTQPDIKDFTYYESDIEGKTNLEKTLDPLLRGKPGARVLKKNVKGQIEGEIRKDPPQRGSDVFLTIDAKVQYIAERALRDAVCTDEKGEVHKGIGRGAAVVVNPNNGEVLAMASVPSFDPNAFIPNISNKAWEQLKSADADPLTNRAVSAYAPGSTYKIPVALAGLKSGEGKDVFDCTGTVAYGGRPMACWIWRQSHGSHGPLNLEGAIKHSCNAYFYRYGNATGIDSIEAMNSSLGLGQKTGIELSNENGGILPGKDWLAKNYPKLRWSSGSTANASIGQGWVLASPLQMAMMAATVANGGVCYYPTLIHKIVHPDGTEERKQPRVRVDLRKEGLSAAQIEQVRHGMWSVVNDPDGTGKKARVPNIFVAGKTGTAQFKRNGVSDNHTWFISFAPYEKPTLAVCVFLQGAKSGGGTAAPIAAKIIKEVLAMKGGYSPELKRLPPAVGNYSFVETVNFERSLPATSGAGDDEVAETPTSDDERIAARGGQKRDDNDAPNIETEADDNSQTVKKPESENALKKKFLFFQRDQKSVPKPANRRG